MYAARTPTTFGVQMRGPGFAERSRPQETLGDSDRHLGMPHPTDRLAPLRASDFIVLTVATPYGELWILIDGPSWTWGGDRWLWPWERAPQA